MQNKYSQILKQKMILFTKMESFDLKKNRKKNNKFLSYFFYSINSNSQGYIINQ